MTSPASPRLPRTRLSFADGRTLLSGQDVSEAIRAEEVSADGLQVAVLPAVRTALLTRQRAFRAAAGAGGRGPGHGHGRVPRRQV